MRWASFGAGGRESYGLVTAGGIVDAATRHPELRTLKDLLASGRIGEIGRALASQRADHAIDAVTYLPVITNPDKIMCAGINYKSHQEETGRDATTHPTIFVRFASSQIGHLQPMLRPRESNRLDYEGEIALVIGKTGRRIPKERALEHVAGFAPYNDGSVRDFQRHTTQFTPGKNFVATGGFGPWMMTPDEIGNLDDMEITTRLNGEVMQNSKAALLIFGFAELIAYCSTFAPLVPGDVIVTGTPGGVGMARNPPVFMKEGDTVEVEVKPIGTLRNRIEVG
jgi:2-keto-4-pentenoate hydratase/2-oxohepta-3-ene-1,7-dioic acid hydratase in catechol pathway